MCGDISVYICVYWMIVGYIWWIYRDKVDYGVISWISRIKYVAVKDLYSNTHEQIQFVACDTVGTVVGYSIKHSDTL